MPEEEDDDDDAPRINDDADDAWIGCQRRVAIWCQSSLPRYLLTSSNLTETKVDCHEDDYTNLVALCPRCRWWGIGHPLRLARVESVFQFVIQMSFRFNDHPVVVVDGVSGTGNRWTTRYGHIERKTKHIYP